MLLAESIEVGVPDATAPPAPARVHPAVAGHHEALRAVLLRAGDLGDEAAAATLLHAAAVLVAVAGPGAARAVARGVPAGVVQAEAGAFDARVAAAEGALGWVRDEGHGRADGDVVIMPGFFELVVVAVAVVAARVMPVLHGDIVVATTGLRVPWQVERVAAARRLWDVDVLDDVDVPGGRDVAGNVFGDFDVDKHFGGLFFFGLTRRTITPSCIGMNISCAGGGRPVVKV